MAEPTIEDYLIESRTFEPSTAFQAHALTADRSLYEEAEADPWRSGPARPASW